MNRSLGTNIYATQPVLDPAVLNSSMKAKHDYEHFDTDLKLQRKQTGGACNFGYNKLYAVGLSRNCAPSKLR